MTTGNTKRELRDEIFEQGRARPMVLEILNGAVYVRPKGISRKRAVRLHVGRYWQAALVRAANLAKAKRRR